MPNTIEAIQNEIQSLQEKHVPVIGGPMGATVKLHHGGEVVNLCSNNYLGLANDQAVTAGDTLAAIRKLKNTPQLVETLRANVAWFREELKKQGFNALESTSAIVPVIVGDTAKAIALAKQMLEQCVMITGFGYPVVPEGAARLRTQISAAHTCEHLETEIRAFDAIRGENK